MAITKEEINLAEIFQDLGNICLTEAHCQKCAEKACLVGYSKASTAECRIKERTYVENGMDNIPPSGIRGGYDEFNVLHAISHLLSQCRSCKQDHIDDCIINVVRSCMEVIEFGDVQGYQGDVITYLAKLQEQNPGKAMEVAEEYQRIKDRKFREEQQA